MATTSWAYDLSKTQIPHPYKTHWCSVLLYMRSPQRRPYWPYLHLDYWHGRRLPNQTPLKGEVPVWRLLSRSHRGIGLYKMAPNGQTSMANLMNTWTSPSNKLLRSLEHVVIVLWFYFHFHVSHFWPTKILTHNLQRPNNNSFCAD